MRAREQSTSRFSLPLSVIIKPKLSICLNFFMFNILFWKEPTEIFRNTSGNLLHVCSYIKPNTFAVLTKSYTKSTDISAYSQNEQEISIRVLTPPLHFYRTTTHTSTTLQDFDSGGTAELTVLFWLSITMLAFVPSLPLNMFGWAQSCKSPRNINTFTTKSFWKPVVQLL